MTEMPPQTGALKRGKGLAAPDGTPKSASKGISNGVSNGVSKSTSKSTSKSSPKPPPGKITCQVERICQDIKRPVREVVTACAMVKPSPDLPARRLCTEKVARGERAGPQLCRSARICKVRQDVNAAR